MPGLELTGAGLRSARPSELLTRQASFPGPPPNLSCLPNTGSLPQTLNSSLNIHSRTPMPGLGYGRGQVWPLPWWQKAVCGSPVRSADSRQPQLLGTCRPGSAGRELSVPGSPPDEEPAEPGADSGECVFGPKPTACSSVALGHTLGASESSPVMWEEESTPPSCGE